MGVNTSRLFNKVDKLFSFDGVRCLAAVVKVYDGDTVWLQFMHKRELIKVRVRLTGIDAPEMKAPADNPYKVEIERAGEHSRAGLAELLESTNYLVYAELGKNDKWGRPLATLYTVKRTCFKYKKDVAISEYMISNGFAYTYNGGTKIPNYR